MNANNTKTPHLSLPCPFCASANLELLDVESTTSRVQVHCLNCGATGPDAVKDMTAIAKWNLAPRVIYNAKNPPPRVNSFNP